MHNAAPHRLAIVASHPIQYYAPWFRHLAQEPNLDLRVFYLWDFGVTMQRDEQFRRDIRWDIDLLEGYHHEFVPNTAPAPGTARFDGLQNPELPGRLRSWQPDSVLAYGYGWRSLLSLARTWRDSPLILRGDTHDLGSRASFSPRRVLRRLYLRRLFRHYTAFATVGAANRAFYLHHGVAPERLFQVPHAVDNDRFAALPPSEGRRWRDQHQISPDDLVVLFAGKFETKKRPDLLAEAFLAAGLDDAILVFIGDGELAPAIDDAVARSPRVRRLGFHNQSEMPAALHAADLLVLPSEGSGETWGLIVNEAMACGTPAIVSTHVGCAADLVIPGETGWTFPARDRPALTTTLQEAARALRAAPDAYAPAVRARIANYSYAAATAGLLVLLKSLAVPRTTPRSP